MLNSKIISPLCLLLLATLFQSATAGRWPTREPEDHDRIVVGGLGKVRPASEDENVQEIVDEFSKTIEDFLIDKMRATWVGSPEAISFRDFFDGSGFNYKVKVRVPIKIRSHTRVVYVHARYHRSTRSGERSFIRRDIEMATATKKLD